MKFRSAVTKALTLSLALAVAAPLVIIDSANAQKPRRHANIPKLPWQKALENLNRRSNPQSDLERAKRSLYSDPARALGLPANRVFRPPQPDAAAGVAPTLGPAVSRLDTNRDGAISRTEYLQGRSRLPNLGVRSNRLNQRWNRRLQSQFRRTDTNRDGKVSAQELQARGNARF